ncbi:MAG TPA: metal-dependent hydrolase [Terriglobales bacterium]|nr:metal-dependent hydrolase [Terriglobales bacterium]
MDNLTYSLVGVALSRLFFKKRVAYATSAMVVAANLPDLDFLYSWPGIRYIEYHRGALHSVWMIPIWAALLAFGMRWWARRKQAAVPAWHMGFLIGVAGVSSHVLLDWCNSDGIRLLAPVSERWFSLDWLPAYDPWIWLLLAAFLGFPMLLTLISSEVGARKSNPHRASALAALVLLAGWVGLRARQHAAALEALNAPNISGIYDGQLPNDWAAFPNPSDPWTWQAVIDLPANIIIADINSPWDTDLAHVHPVRSYIKPPRVPAIAAGEGTPIGATFLWFARFPFADVEEQGGGQVVTITDMRFAQGAYRPTIKAKIWLDGGLQVVRQSFQR